MALGKTHDRFNFLLAFLFLGLLLWLQLDLLYCSFFILGWIYSTFYFSPDSDLMPKRKLGLLRILFYPYTMFSKHRGRSHKIIMGTVIRAAYSLLVVWFVIHFLKIYNFIDLTPGEYVDFLLGFDLAKLEYKIIVWFYIGMFLADACHIFLDKIWDMFSWLR